MSAAVHIIAALLHATVLHILQSPAHAVKTISARLNVSTGYAHTRTKSGSGINIILNSLNNLILT